MAGAFVLATAVGVVVLAAREGRRASRSRTPTVFPVGPPTSMGAMGWTSVAEVSAAPALTGRAPAATTTGPSRRACACAARCGTPGTGASGCAD